MEVGGIGVFKREVEEINIFKGIFRYLEKELEDGLMEVNKKELFMNLKWLVVFNVLRVKRRLGWRSIFCIRKEEGKVFRDIFFRV